MNHPIIPIARIDPPSAPAASANAKPRRAAASTRRRSAEVQALLGAESRQRDLLIEHLHKLQDHFGCLSSAHMAALAQEMRLAQTEVYEVATFYHHFDVVKEGEAAPAALTVRVCAGLSCEMAGAQELLAKLPTLLGRDVRVLEAPCIGRCEQAPAAVVGQHAVPYATRRDDRRQSRRRRDPRRASPATSTTPPTAAPAATRCCATASPAGTRSRTSSGRSKRPACAAWAAPASRWAASGASCAPKQARA